MTTDEETMERLLRAVGEGAEAPPDVEGSVESILHRLGVDGDQPVPRPPPPPRRPIPWGMVAILLIGITVGVASAVIGMRLGQDPEAPTVETLTPPPESSDLAASGGPSVEVPAPTPLPQDDAVEPEPVFEEVAPEPRPEAVAVIAPVPTPVVEPTRVPPSDEGLVAHGDAAVRIRGRAAVLSSGLLTFIRNDSVQPGVDHVRFATLPVTALPVGTVFTSAAAPGVAAISVEEGRVFVVADNGTPLAEARPGEAVAVLHDPAGDLAVVRLVGLALDEVTDQIPEGSLAEPETLRRLVAELRLAPVHGNALETLLEFGVEDLE